MCPRDSKKEQIFADAAAVRLAELICEALRRNKPRALIEGSPAEGDCTLIDGLFDLVAASREILDEMAGRAQS